MNINNLQKNWEALAVEDPLWAVLTDPSKKGGQWNQQEFYETGIGDAARFMAMATRVYPDLPRGNALDFGCGVGRVTFALRKYFANVTGVDISETMLRNAEEHNVADSGVNFILNQRPDLECLESDSFDFVFSRIVLQHMHPEIALGYLQEFVRILRPGGACMFQLPALSTLDESNPPQGSSVMMEMWGMEPGRIIQNLKNWRVDLLLVEREVACGDEIPSYIYVFSKAQ